MVEVHTFVYSVSSNMEPNPVTYRHNHTQLNAPWWQTVSPDIPARIAAIYEQRLAELRPVYAFHWHSRRWLWSAHPPARRYLDQQQVAYVGTTRRDQISRVEHLLREQPRESHPRFAAERLPRAQRCPHLLAYNRVLFYILFARTLYGIDVRPAVTEVISAAELNSYHEAVRHSAEDICYLASWAVNYLYLTHYLWQTSVRPFDLTPLTTSWQWWQPRTVAELELLLYGITHAVIGESLFYSRPVIASRPLLQHWLSIAETLLLQSYSAISLDLKCELLVAARLADRALPELARYVAAEAAEPDSSPAGFLINRQPSQRHPQTLNSREHSNVLFVMAHTARRSVRTAAVY